MGWGAGHRLGTTPFGVSEHKFGGAKLVDLLYLIVINVN